MNFRQFNSICKKKYRTLALKYHPDRWANASDEEKKSAEEKFKEIAEELGMGEKGVAAIYYRTVKKLRDILEGDE